MCEYNVHRRTGACQNFAYSEEILVSLELRYELCHGICLECGFFGHDNGVCAKGLVERMIEAANSLF